MTLARILMVQKKIILALFIVGALSACSNDDVAEIDGEGVTKEQFQSYLDFKKIKIRDDEHRLNVLQQYVDRAVLTAAIEKQGIADADEINAEMENFRQQLYISRYFEQYLNEKVTDQEMQNYYVSHQNEYEHKQAHVAHILFRTNRDMQENEKASKQTAAQEVYSKLKAGSDFKELANKNSEDKNSANKGGDLGWIKQGTINKVFSEKAFSLKKGEYSEPFATPFGYHVVMLLDDTKAVKQSFETVKGDIRYKLRQQAKEAEIKKLKDSISFEVEK